MSDMSDPDYRYDPTNDHPLINTGCTIGAILLVIVLIIGNIGFRVSFQVDSRPFDGVAPQTSEK